MNFIIQKLKTVLRNILSYEGMKTRTSCFGSENFICEAFSQRELAQLKNSNHWTIDMIAEFYMIEPKLMKEILEYHNIL